MIFYATREKAKEMGHTHVGRIFGIRAYLADIYDPDPIVMGPTPLHDLAIMIGTMVANTLLFIGVDVSDDFIRIDAEL